MLTISCFFFVSPKVRCNNRNKFSRFRFYFHNEITFGVPLSGTLSPATGSFSIRPIRCVCVCGDGSFSFTTDKNIMYFL